MYPYAYSVSLRVRHPFTDPADITKQLGLQPKICWKHGERKVAPDGRILEGYRNGSYWCHSFATPDDSNLAGFLERTTAAMSPHANYFRDLRSGGGSVEFFIGWSSEGVPIGEVLPHDLLTVCGRFGIDLALDIYGYKDREKPDELRITRDDAG